MTIKKYILIIQLFIFSILIGCQGKGLMNGNNIVFSSAKEMVNFTQMQIKQIDVLKFKALKLSNDIYIIDVRTKNEFTKGSIPGAIHIQRGILEFKLDNASKWESLKSGRTYPKKNAMIYVYCKKGSRGTLSTKALNQLGFTNVINVKGGYEAYRSNDNNKNAPIVKDDDCG